MVSAPSTAARRVTVVVPSYNHGRYLERCLRSVFAQTLAPARLVVIDDGSRDGSAALAEGVLRDSPWPAELVARENRGLCATLNQGLAMADSEYFAYLGSDDAWHPDRLRAGVEALEANPDAVLSYSDCFVVDAEDVVVGTTQDWAQYASGNLLPLLLRGESIPMSPTVLYRRAPLARFGWPEASRLEDYQLYLQLAALGPFLYVPRTLAYWRRHGTNNSRNLAMMLDEAVRAQARVAPSLGLSPAELRRCQASLRFRDAGYYLAAGERWRAIRLSLGNLHGAPGPAAVARRLIQLAAPRWMVDGWRRRRAARAAGPRAGAHSL